MMTMNKTMRLSRGCGALLGAALIVACSSSAAPSTPAGTSGVDGGGAGADSDSSSAAATDGSTTGDPDAAAVDGATAAFALTSTAIAEGASFPAENTCSGANTSPPLSWTAGPAGTKSYAIVLNDTTINFLHFIVYDIPSSVVALPAALEAAYAPAAPAGAHETKSYKNAFGYAGPCPPVEHVYEFVLYALDVATLPGVTQNVALADAETAIKAHELASTKLTAKYKK
jgi:Raf kinase inhibitor-like YbhB/YbcL family protein